MVYVPSESLNAVLSQVNVGIWLDRLTDGRTALVCKVPETIIKAIYRGATTTLLMASIRAESLTVLCLGLWVDDERERPFKVLMVNSSESDKALLLQVLESHVVTLHLFNELVHPALSAWCALDPAAADIAAAALKESNHWVLTPAFSETTPLRDLSRILGLVLDRFQAHVHRVAAERDAPDIGFTARVPMGLDIWPHTETLQVTPHSIRGPYMIGDGCEGPKLESMIGAVLDSVYPGRVFISPLVRNGKVARELADALAFDDAAICVIQAKALAVLSADRRRPSSRRIANVEKDIKKGLKQLAGAVRAIRSGIPISSREDGGLVKLAGRHAAPAHAILVLSEMYFGTDWAAVAGLVARASETDSRRALFHVLDVQELAMLSTGCKDSTAFSNRLIQRWVAVQEKGTAYMRTRLPTSL